MGGLCSSIDHPLDLLVEAINARSETHVHELGLGVHLEAAQDGLVDFELDHELLPLVLGVRLQGSEHLILLRSGKLGRRDHGDLLLLVELLIELGVLIGNLLDVHEALVLSKDLNEADGDCVEITSLLEALVEFVDFLDADTCVESEHLEAL